jgi:Ca-activated chloride channel family protein
MKRIFKVRIMAGLLLGLAVIFTACVEQKTSEVKAEQSLATLQKETIVLDDTKGSASTTRNFYFIFDGSGSMDGDCGGVRKIDGAKEAVRKFLAQVPSDVNLGLYSFNEQGSQEFVPLGPDNRAKFLEAFSQFQPDNNTPLVGAIKVGVDKLVEQYKQQLGYGEFRLIVVTDGEATDGNVEDATLYAAKYGIPIYTIGLCIGDNHPLRIYSLSYRAANNPQDLAKALEQATAEASDFNPTDFPADTSGK